MFGELDYARDCEECEHVLYSSEDKGLCDRLNDTHFLFRVNLKNGKCLYQNPGMRISCGEIEIRKQKTKSDKENFLKSLKEASRKIQDWPEWKKNYGELLFN